SSSGGQQFLSAKRGIRNCEGWKAKSERRTETPDKMRREFLNVKGKNTNVPFCLRRASSMETQRHCCLISDRCPEYCPHSPHSQYPQQNSRNHAFEFLRFTTIKIGRVEGRRERPFLFPESFVESMNWSSPSS